VEGETAPRLEVPAVAMELVELLSRELGVSGVVAQVLARRGLGEVAAAREFLEASTAHSWDELRGIDDAVALVLGHVASGSRITVHGDYDCDGVCSTAILVSVLRELGGDVDWYLPDRLDDGYGLAAATVRRVADRGTRLLITADCAITAVEEVALARACGLDVLVTDHHSPRADGALPDAPSVHPALCGYPCPQLCATAVAAKLSEALRVRAGLGGGERDAELELVALATVADVVALRGENRRLVRAGLRALAVTARPGLRALMRAAAVTPLRVDERAIAFRLAPRINAAGRLYRADTALELLLTADEARAGELAGELDRANAERRDTETRIRFEAEAQLGAFGPAPAYVLAAPCWHPGVVGIVAARIAERHHRPVVLVALPAGEGPELAAGSGRSIPAFDLLAGLRSASDHLVRCGGHRAAAGLTLEPAALEDFRAAFVGHAGAVLAPEDLVAVERVDAVASGEDVGLALAEQLGRLAPFGAGNPPVSLLLAAATFSDPVGFGGERRDQHARFTVTSGGSRAGAVGFGVGPRPPVEPDVAVDATFTLERNEWHGVVEPRLLLRSVRRCAPAPIAILGEEGGYLERTLAEIDRGGGAVWPVPVGPQRRVVDRRGRGVAALLTQLVVTREPVLVVCADAVARERHLQERLGGFSLASYNALERGALTTDGFHHVLLLDPPPDERALQATSSGGSPDSRIYLAFGPPEIRFALYIHEQEFGLRDQLAACYRALRDGGGAAGRELEAVLRGAAPRARSPELAGRLLAVLTEIGLVELDRKRVAAAVTARRRATLEDSPAYRAYRQRHEDGLRYLGSRTRQAA
jgi:single-stranded-DNA-specific exonuclease